MLLWFLVAPVAGLLSLLAGSLLAAAILDRPGAVPIVVYHSVSPDAGWLPWAANTSVRPETFRRHLEVLRRRSWTVMSTRAFLAARQNGSPVRKNTVVLHFDDGYLDNYLFAVPMLREFKMPATFFISTDFIEPGDEARTCNSASGPADWAGYMNRAEIRAIDEDDLFEIEAHGTDHARIPVSGRTVDRLTETNWRRHVPLAWAHDGKNKSRWFEAESPPFPLRVGHPVPENDSALAGRWWRDCGAESDAAFEDRIRTALTTARTRLEEVLGRSPAVLAWPFDRSCPVSVGIAREAGFAAVTGGIGENRPDEDPTVLSRVHVHDRAFGGGPLWLEGLAFRAKVNSASGRLAWHVLVALAARLRQRRFGRPGYGATS